MEKTEGTSSQGSQPENKTAVGSTGYIDVVYSDARRPRTGYPVQLASHLRTEYLTDTGRLLDLGCGRGEMLHAFADLGYQVAGVDIAPKVGEFCHPHEAHVVNLDGGELPFDAHSFDIVFSKSVIEHLQNPMPFLQMARNVLKPGGKLILMTPSWLHHGWGPFYLDHTHVTPFTMPSLRDVLTISGFEQTNILHFRQLPFLWKRPYLSPLVSAFAKLPLHYSPMYEMKYPWSDGINKLIRFSKEVMLLSVSSAPGPELTGSEDV